VGLVRLERNAPHQKYFLQDGSEVVGASTIAKLGDSPEPLIYWAWKQGKDGKSYKRTRDAAADAGAVGHFMVDCYLRGNDPDLREFDVRDIDKAENVFLSFLSFWQSENMQHLAIEEQLVSETHRFGGTIDLVARDENDRIVLLDWKSSKGVYDGHRRQLGGYEILWNENKDKKIERRAIIRIGRDEDDLFDAHWISNEEANKNMEIFKKQAALYNQIRDGK
jgi:hypothetical protein